MTNIFETATREKFRFASNKGMINVEALWDMPLTSRSGFDLDNVAKAVNAELKANTEESFVTTTTNPAKATLELKLEIVKHIIAAKQAENEAVKTAAAKRAEKQKLLEILEKKKDASLENLTEEQIAARLAALS